jgi:hypothetical protein
MLFTQIGFLCPRPLPLLCRFSLELSAWTAYGVDMNPNELDQLLKGYLEAKFGAALDYFAIEAQMSPDEGRYGCHGELPKTR